MSTFTYCLVRLKITSFRFETSSANALFLEKRPQSYCFFLKAVKKSFQRHFISIILTTFAIFNVSKITSNILEIKE
ncbi:hypothetical protein NC99_38990 [Sunxiuqinia dokdonensis]|uniref:Uncharacterized protein n=1 Tax=Sunxiuqinia dokdonensis TaxID=1409788 RepID=A0A0L8V4C0_9BACT|nr:hypothetical protein NC99_38990 [Sunxiuqinia dokdonensis]